MWDESEDVLRGTQVSRLQVKAIQRSIELPQKMVSVLSSKGK